MKNIFLGLLLFLLFNPVVAQFVTRPYSGYGPKISTFRFDLDPTIDVNQSAVIRKLGVFTDSLFRLPKNTRHTVWQLMSIQYFDSAGLLLEADKYDDNGLVIEMTNYSYEDGLLFRKEVVGRNLFSLGAYSRNISIYEYDSAGNNTSEKYYRNYSDTATSFFVYDRDYDEHHCLVREFLTQPKGVRTIHHEYSYDSAGRVLEMKVYDFDNSYLYSYLHEYRKKKNAERIYLMYNPENKQLEKELFYDDSNRLATSIRTVRDQTETENETETLIYRPDGLVGTHEIVLMNTEHFQYRHGYAFRK